MGNSKRNISKLTDDYRDKIADYAISKNLKCRDAILVLKSTGCRPNELKNGVRIRLSNDLKNIEFLVVGSKLNAKQKRGIRLRKISVSLNENNKYLQPLVDQIIANENHNINVTITSENSFSGYITKISKKIWPRKHYHASSYSFRHSFATDLKNSGASHIEIAKCMGHASTRSQQSYGRKRRGSSGSLSPVADVETSAAPRDKSDRLLRFKIKNKNKIKTPSLNELADKLGHSPKMVSEPPRKKLKR